MNTVPKKHLDDSITKVEAASRQLCCAIRLFFADDDPIAVHTLAGAAREIFEKRLQKAGRPRFLDYFHQAHPQMSEKQILAMFNKARNFFKHDSKESDDTIPFNDFSNDWILFVAGNECARLMGRDQPEEVDVFNQWFAIIYDMFPEPDILEILKLRCGDFRQVSRSDQKKVGAKMLADYTNLGSDHSSR